MPEQTVPQAPAAPRREALRFTGRAGEYFRIWVVNLALSVITLGLYSPWAKVRRNKYFYRHTRLADASFDYHADPVAILKGRLIAVALFVAYSVLTAMQSAWSAVVALAGALAFPWLLVRSRMFALRNTSYRGVRFRFRPAYAEAYRTLIGGMLLSVLTLGLYLPHFQYRRARLLVDNSAFGTLPLRLGARARSPDFYAIYLGAGLLALLCVFLLGIFSVAFAPPQLAGMEADAAAPGFQVGVTLLSALVYLAFYFGVEGAVARLVFNGIEAGRHQLHCRWSLPGYVFLRLSNLLAILCSAGLLIPWAAVRLHRYRIEHMSAAIDGELDDVVAAEEQEVSALGEEIGEAFDFDLGL